MIFFTADTHFGHGKMAAHRGFRDVEQMNAHMIEVWNEAVRPGDQVYHLGDVSFMGGAKTRDVLDQLNGSKYLVPGNHDRGLNALTKSCFTAGVLGPIVNLKHSINQPDGTSVVHRFVLSHFPLLSWDRMHHKSIMLHGHCHGTARYPHPNNRIMDVGVDTLDASLAPISIDRVLAIMGTRSFASVDQHNEKDNDE